jgi:ribonucleoside-diphosphate reductase alpha chain
VQAFAESFAKAGSAIAAMKSQGVSMSGGAQASASAVVSSTLSAALESLGDAPACDGCGTITVRSGTCYKCLNCGASMGCS